MREMRMKRRSNMSKRVSFDNLTALQLTHFLDENLLKQFNFSLLSFSLFFTTTTSKHFMGKEKGRGRNNLQNKFFYFFEVKLF